MKLKLAMLTFTFAISTTAAWAGEGHSHGPGGHSHSHGGHSHSHTAPIGEEKVKSRSQEEIARLIKKGKLEESWLNAEFVSSEKKKFKGKEEWLVIYKNDSSEKKNLYIFLSLSGKYIAANHTGK